MIPTHGYAAFSATAPLAPFKFERREVGPKDIHIEILFCGVCHSDIHQARNEWDGTQFPVVPGHEIVGRVVKVGRDVKKFKEGDSAAVGCLVDSCGHCDHCREDQEQYCPNKTFTYNSPDSQTGAMTYGGYSSNIVVKEDFALKVPKGLDLAGTAPLLCAGITTYSPLRHWKVGKGQKVGVVGLGGLGHMGVKFANALGAHVVLFTTSPNKVKDGLALGAHEVVISKNEDEMKKHAGSFHFILNTVSAPIDVSTYLNLLRRDGTVCQVGAPPTPVPVQLFSLIFCRGSLAGSLIGGIRETQEMLDFCGERNITSEIELIKINQINEAFERVLKSDVKYRFVIGM
ncbi:NAD(P)-dependent alcohol dehydrogenase [Candidatus Sumerlaeota bacterium]|nr:NAD(P)-dependent alcohol dehydrogenase [Candidatus Sumerlaeota bacterium]